MKFRYLSTVEIMRLGCVVCASVMLSACGNDEFTDLDNYIKDVKNTPKTDITPVQEAKTVEPFLFTLDGSRDPFRPVKKDEDIDNEDEEEAGSNGIQPDFSRRTEDLEGYPLDALQMVGTIKKDKLWALIRSEEGVQKVNIGNYMGKNHGKIVEISETEIHLEEIIPDKKPKTWLPKSTVIPLTESE